MTFLEKLGKSNEKRTRSMIDFTISNLCPEDLGYEDKSPCGCTGGYSAGVPQSTCRKCWEREMEGETTQPAAPAAPLKRGANKEGDRI